MVHLRRVPHDRCMGRHRDEKLRIIAESVVGRGCSHRELYELGRAGDLIDCPAGGTFHSERDASQWAYVLINGDVAVSTSINPLDASQVLALRSLEVSRALDSYLALAR